MSLLCMLGRHELEIIYTSPKYELYKCKHCGMYESYNAKYRCTSRCWEYKYLPVALLKEMEN